MGYSLVKGYCPQVSSFVRCLPDGNISKVYELTFDLPYDNNKHSNKVHRLMKSSGYAHNYFKYKTFSVQLLLIYLSSYVIITIFKNDMHLFAFI